MTKMNLITATILAASLSGSAQAAKTGNVLKEECTSNYEMGKGICFGYIEGVMESANPRFQCIPDGVTKGQIRDIVTKYLKDNPEKLHQSAGILVNDVLKDAFPCKVTK